MVLEDEKYISNYENNWIAIFFAQSCDKYTLDVDIYLV